MAAATGTAGKARGGIGRGELFSLMLCLSLGGVAFSGWPYDGIAKAWTAALAVGLFIGEGQVTYNYLFAGQSFAAALEYALGRVPGRIVLFAYVLLWLVLVLAAVAYAVLLWQALGLPSMPVWLYVLLFLLTVGAIAAAGAEPLARLSLLIVIPALLLVLGNLALTLAGADFANLLPLNDGGFAAWGQGADAGVLLFGWFSVLLPFWHRVRCVKNRRGTVLAAVLGAVLPVLLLALGMRITLSVLVGAYNFPMLQVFRLAQVGHWFSRFEVLGAALLAVILLLRAAAALTAAVIGMCELWQLKSPRGVWAASLGAALAVGAVLLILGYAFGDWRAMLLWLAHRLIYALLLGSAVMPWVINLAGWLRLRANSRTVLVDHSGDVPG